MNNLNIPFKDGNKLRCYTDDSYHISGCPTCDFGAEYINKIRVTTTHYQINLIFKDDDKYAFTTSDAIRMFAKDLGSMTEEEFTDYVQQTAKQYEALSDCSVKKGDYQ